MLDYHLPNSLLTAYNNCWLTTEELELMITRVECILRIAADTLDSGAYREYFKYLVEQCCPHLADLLQEMGERAENPEKTYGWESFSSKVYTENISSDNLQQYYSCEISGINYSSFSVWKALIQFELINDKELTLLYQTLEKHYFPSSNYSRMNHCFHIIIAVLISDSKTKPKAIDFLMNHAGRSGLIILIRAFALIGEDQQGRQCVEQLVRLCEAMVYPSSEYIGKATLPSNRNWKIISSVCNSTISDWNRESEDNIMHFLADSKIAIKWDCYEDQEPFFEEWATTHPDKNAYITKYYICYEEEIIKVFGMVYVDGRRALIPLPSLRTKHIDRASYNFACLVNSDVETLNSYICRSGLIVD